MNEITKDKYKITFNRHDREPTHSIVSGKIIRLLLRECGFTYYEIDGHTQTMDLKKMTKSMSIKRLDEKRKDQKVVKIDGKLIEDKCGDLRLFYPLVGKSRSNKQ